MEVMAEVASLQRVTTAAVEIEPRAPGDENLMKRVAIRAVQALEKIAPTRELVQLVERPELGDRGRSRPVGSRADRQGVPVEVQPTGLTRNGPNNCRFAALTRSREQHHLPAEIGTETRCDPALDHATTVFDITEFCPDKIRVMSKISRLAPETMHPP